MSNWAGGVLTAAGRVLQAKVEAGLTSLDITKIKLGDGTETMGQVDNLTDLVSPKCVLGISTATQTGQTAEITGVVTTSQIVAGFYCREWGLFANDPSAGEILYMITIDTTPEWIPANSAAAQVSATYAMNIAVANATQITARIDLAGLVDVDMLNAAVHAVLRSTTYVARQLATASTLKSGLILRCITGGTTRAALVDWSQYSLGDTVTDGTVVWKVTEILDTTSTLDATKLSGTVPAASTPNCVHTTGNETVGGTKTFSAAINTTGLRITNPDSEGAWISPDPQDGSKVLKLYSAGASKDGATLQLHGKSTSDAPGAFRLSTGNGTSTISLVGRPDGTLAWNGHTVLDSTSTLDATKLSGAIPAASTSNCVHTSGNETVAGTKTFSSAIVGNLTGTASENLTATSALDATKLSGTVPAASTPNCVHTTGNETVAGVKTFTGSYIALTPPSGEGGHIYFNASTAETTQGGFFIDQYNSTMRIVPVASADGTSKTGGGTLNIDPFAKTITGGYTFTGNVTGAASDNVHLTGNETVAGTKTFSSAINAAGLYITNPDSATAFICPSPSDGTKVLKLYSAGASKDGATLQLCGKSASDAGKFRLSTGNGASTISLVGSPNGDLVWNDDKLLRGGLLYSSSNTSVSITNETKTINTYTIPSAGTYLIIASQFISYSATSSNDLHIYQGNSDVCMCRFMTSGTYTTGTLRCEKVLTCAKNDVITVKLAMTGTTAHTTNADGRLSYMQVIKLL